MLTMVSSHSRQETREGQQRPVNKEYYYIDFHATVDAIKYRIFRLTNQVKDMYKPSDEKKDYHCPRCRAQWTQLEVLDRISMTGDFLCHRCDGVLERDDISAADMAGHERQSKLMAQLEKLLKLMPLIDSQMIPNNNFETAFSNAIPVERNEAINPTRKMEPLEVGKGLPTAVKGMTQTAQAPLEISLTTTSERTAAEQAAEVKRKAEVAAQNILPVWHTASTVTGEATALGNRERERLASGSAASVLKNEEEEKKDGNVLNDELAAYYAQMQQEKEKEAREDRDADADSESEDEFEDVGIGASGAATPSSSVSAGMNGSKAPSLSMNGSQKHKLESESGSSAPGTGMSTPAASGTAADDVAMSAAKRVKLEDPRNGIPVGKESPEKPEKDSDEDEEAEFEDAL